MARGRVGEDVDLEPDPVRGEPANARPGERVVELDSDPPSLVGNLRLCQRAQQDDQTAQYRKEPSCLCAFLVAEKSVRLCVSASQSG